MISGAFSSELDELNDDGSLVEEDKLNGSLVGSEVGTLVEVDSLVELDELCFGGKC